MTRSAFAALLIALAGCVPDADAPDAVPAIESPIDAVRCVDNDYFRCRDDCSVMLREVLAPAMCHRGVCCCFDGDHWVPIDARRLRAALPREADMP